jgi:hypothetical protein
MDWFAPIAIRLALFPVVLLAACSSALDSGAARLPGFQADGTYILTDQEKSLDCERLLERSQAISKQIQEISDRAVGKLNSEKNTAAAALGRLIGYPSAEAAEIAEYNRLKGMLAAIESERTRKGCVAPKVTPAPNKRAAKLHL